jgi:hypothetical protein
MIYIGNFLYLSNQEKNQTDKRRHGEFNLIVEADGIETAVDLFKQRIVQLKKNRDFFEGQCSIIINQFLGVDNFSTNKATIINYKSIAGDPVMPFIGCSFPTSESDDCRIYEWKDIHLEIDSEKSDLFMEFNAS